jgi:hypothetical protein
MPAVAGGYIYLTADNGFYTCPGGPIKQLHCTEHIAMVRYGNGIHSKISGLFNHLVNANGTVEQAVFGMNMKMNKGGFYSHFFLGQVPLKPFFKNGALSLSGFGTDHRYTAFSCCKMGGGYDTVLPRFHQDGF